jgi:arabinan endo-1,5-alpha-L-arabinosidase
MRNAQRNTKIMKLHNRGARFLTIGVMLVSAMSAQGQSAVSPHIYHVEGDVEGVHDPSIIKQGGTWYLFGTATEKGPHAQLPMRCSNDLEHWKRCGAVFAAIPDWIQKESPETKDLWAPDISYFNGKYHVFGLRKEYLRHRSGHQQNPRPIQPRFSLGGRRPGAEIPGQRRL